MTDKLEEVARAICDHSVVSVDACYGPKCPCWAGAKTKAKAAIEAHEKALEAQGLVIVPREPTDKMVFAASHLKGLRAANRLIKPTSHEVWKAMTDAALEGE